jgi:hypothetical protein
MAQTFNEERLRQSFDQPVIKKSKVNNIQGDYILNNINIF